MYNIYIVIISKGTNAYAQLSLNRLFVNIHKASKEYCIINVVRYVMFLACNTVNTVSKELVLEFDTPLLFKAAITIFG